MQATKKPQLISPVAHRITGPMLYMVSGDWPKTMVTSTRNTEQRTALFPPLAHPRGPIGGVRVRHSQRAEAEDDGEAQPAAARQIEAPDGALGQQEDGDVGDEVDDARGELESIERQADAAGDGKVPDGGERPALEDEQEDGGDAEGGLQRRDGGRRPPEARRRARARENEDAAPLSQDGDLDERQGDRVEEAEDEDVLRFGGRIPTSA